jgi:hypothetical protein
MLATANSSWLMRRPAISRIRGGDQHFLILLANQRRLNLPQFAHSFALFVHVVRSSTSTRVDGRHTFSISWLPRSLAISIFGSPEPGVNLAVRDTLDWAASIASPVTARGPYRIKPEFFERARQRREFLDSGSSQFVVLDGKHRRDGAFNCMHAISDLGLTPHLLDTGFAYGLRANQRILDYFSPWILDANQTHSWLADLLELRAEGIHMPDLVA